MATCVREKGLVLNQCYSLVSLHVSLLQIFHSKKKKTHQDLPQPHIQETQDYNFLSLALPVRFTLTIMADISAFSRISSNSNGPEAFNHSKIESLTQTQIASRVPSLQICAPNLRIHSFQQFPVFKTSVIDSLCLNPVLLES